MDERLRWTEARLVDRRVARRVATLLALVGFLNIVVTRVIRASPSVEQQYNLNSNYYC